ncbi:MAG: hypothetical protein KAH25_03775, partial [Bacteroidales bacterium]|nr:hypothetical protein [Bacteroidales bacterium]
MFLGDSLLNNPYPTGDSAMAYLYRIDNDKTVFIDTNYYTNFSYFWFSQKLKAKYIIKTELLKNSAHINDYTSTYFGNTNSWEEAEIVDLKQNEYRKNIHLVKKKDSRKEKTSIQGTIYDFMDYKVQQNQLR